jgi:hypothetical protein
MKANKKSLFEQMHEGERNQEGSFDRGLQKLFYLADADNSVKLVRAFPEFFGSELPAWGVTADKVSACKL